jgi:lysozyme family protein
MAAATYDTALTHLLQHEGGYTNHPDDPGGPTNFGITIADYRRYAKADATAADMRAMPVGEAKAIYRKRYWDAQRCDELPAGVDYAVFDYGVNSGIGRSGKVLRRLLNLPDNTSVVGDDVIAAAQSADARALVSAICDERLRFLKSLKTWAVFGNGWGRRVDEVKAVALQMATPVAAKPAAPKAVSPVKAGGVAAGAGASAAAAHQAGLPIGLVIAVAAAAALAALLLIHVLKGKD